MPEKCTRCIVVRHITECGLLWELASHVIVLLDQCFVPSFVGCPGDLGTNINTIFVARVGIPIIGEVSAFHIADLASCEQRLFVSKLL